MGYLAIVKQTGGTVEKYQDFATEAEADAHVVTYGGFVVQQPTNLNFDYLVADSSKKTLTFDQARYDNDQALINSTQYQRDRKPLYGTWEEQLDMMYHGTWKDHVAKVKADIPKGNS